MLGRYHLMEHGGGDKVQIENTARELRALGADVEIKTDEDFIPQNYDIIHLFQLDWTPETYLYAQKAHDAGKPIILSPIHHSIKERVISEKMPYTHLPLFKCHSIRNNEIT